MKKPKIKARVMMSQADFGQGVRAPAKPVLVIPFDDPDALVEQMVRAMLPRSVNELSPHVDVASECRYDARAILKSLGVKVRAK
jgi:hypothetical protein